jgi:hypothetical protein
VAESETIEEGGILMMMMVLVLLDEVVDPLVSVGMMMGLKVLPLHADHLP